MFLREVFCNLCNSNDYRVLSRPSKVNSEDEVFSWFSASSDVKSKLQIVKCRKCGLVYVNPRPDKITIIEAYKKSCDERYISQEKGRLLTFKKNLDFIEKIVQKKGRILDVGCAAGFFLKVAKESGWESYGIEPSEWLGEYGRNCFGANIFTGTIEESNFQDSSFEVVTLWDSLEHMDNPFQALFKINRILKKDGFLIINYPDSGSIFAKILKDRWWFNLSTHLYYFTIDTLSQMLKKIGFDIIYIRPHIQFLSLDYILLRSEFYFPIFSKPFQKLSNLLHLNGLLIPYYASQINVVAKCEKKI